MCTFLSTLPRKSKTAGTEQQKRNLALYLRECPDNNGSKTWYQFRLLNFSAKNSNRDYPFIARYVHQKWGTNSKGFRVVEKEVVCPVTKWVEWEGNRYDDCPICKYAGQQYGAWKESGFKDADSRKKNKEFSRKFQGIIPVYVINDPTYAANNNKYRVIILNDKKVYDDFVKRVEKQLLKANCFNGGKAVDCLMHISMVEHVSNEGQPNEYRWKQKEIDSICFLKAEKAYELPAITRESIDAFPFDDEYYVPSTAEDLKEFYDTYISVSLSSDDIDSDDDEVPVYDAPAKEVVKKTNAVKSNAMSNDTPNPEPETDEDLDDLLSDPDDKGLEVKDEPVPDAAPSIEATKEEKADEVSLDELLKDIDD